MGHIYHLIDYTFFLRICSLVTVHRTRITVPMAFREGIPWPIAWHSNKRDERSPREIELLQTQGFDPQVGHSKNRFYFFGASWYWPKIIRFTRDCHIKYKFYLLVTKRKTTLANRLEYSWQQDWYHPPPPVPFMEEENTVGCIQSMESKSRDGLYQNLWPSNANMPNYILA